MTREMLNPRRQNITMSLCFPFGGTETEFAVTYGFDKYGRAKEAFCMPFKTGTDLQALLHHAFIAISVGLQHGVSMAELARVLGEDEAGPPRSIIGAVVRTGAFLEADMAGTVA
jgi:hypothetical protein